MQLTGGTGTYSFDSAGGAAPGLQLNCIVTNTTPDAGIATIRATSNGSYSNSVCGTGTADSTGNTIPLAGVNVLAEAPPAGDLKPWIVAQQDDLDYHILFAGTVGALTFTTSHAGNATGGGPVQIADPTPANTGGPLDTGCTRDFQVTGALVGSVPAE